MNKFFSFLSVLLMFTCCAPQERDSADIPALPYEILAPAGTDSKTATIDNMHIVWELNDALSVFHAPTGTDQYVNDGLFTIDDVSTGHAQGEAAVPDGASDWYFLYPYNDKLTSPNGADAPIVIGAPVNNVQIQKANADYSHTAGSAFPLWGKAKNIGKDAVPIMSVHHAASLIELSFSRKDEKAIQLSEAVFRAKGIAINGTFTIDFSGDEPVYTPVEAADSCKLIAETAFETAPKATVWMGIRPFTAPAGTEVEIIFRGSDADGKEFSQTKTITLDKDWVFSAGRIKHLAFLIDDPVYPVYSFVKASSIEPGLKYIMVVQDGENSLIAKAPASASSLLDATPAERVSETIINVNSLKNAFVIDVSAISSTGFTIQCADWKYLGTTNTNNLATSESTTTNYYIWSISFNEDGASLKSRTRYLKYDPAKKVFGGYSNTSSTTFPDLYYLPDSHVAEDRLLKESIPGFYPLRGNRRIYTAGSDQMSIYKTASGEVTFSILNPKELTVMQVTGLRETLQKEQVLSIVEIDHTKKSSTQKSPQPYRVIQVRDDKAWLLHPSGDGYIVRIR